MVANKKYVSMKFSESKLKKRDQSLAVLYDIGSDLTGRKHPDSEILEGSGLGPAIVKEVIIQTHGGRVWFEIDTEKPLPTRFFVAISKNLKADSMSGK